ncbi:unnamed protein product [Ranitomeya imitator]|uniref:Uncharacterized protein n=1 Tax=Ranitomeya imitator TaxID=111125 RepID=A0ABN9M3B8_9NEOB|nr:unnamed protein product [Ranitomeya imitator]
MGYSPTPKYGSLTYAHFKAGDSMHSMDNTRPAPDSTAPDYAQSKSSSSGYSSSHAVGEIHGKIISSPKKNNCRSNGSKEQTIKPTDLTYTQGRFSDDCWEPCGHCSLYSKKNPLRSPVKENQDHSPRRQDSSPISITTMDPQLHLKQAIKLQFEGRTCGDFN